MLLFFQVEYDSKQAFRVNKKNIQQKKSFVDKEGKQQERKLMSSSCLRNRKSRKFSCLLHMLDV